MKQDLTAINPWRSRRGPSFLFAVAIATALGASALFAAQLFDFGSRAPVEAEPAVDELGIDPGGVAVLPIRIDFPGTHHLNSVPAPTFAVREPAGITVGKIELLGDSHFDELLEVEVYEGVVNVMVELSAASSMSGEYTLRGDLTYYPCSDADLTCFEQVDPLQVSLRVEPGASSAAAATATGGSSPLTDTGSTLARRISESFAKSIWLAYLLVFLGGILASFTPCVYPMIPITVAVIGAGSGGSRSRGFRLSIAYVLGIAITYSILGAAAAGTGKAFGSFTQTFPVLLGIGLLLGFLGTAMFGFFEIQPPSFMTKLQSKRGQGTAGVIAMGVVTGLVASPCLGPVLLALLAWIAKTGDVLRGFTLLFVFAIGMGLLLIAIGTFAGVLTALPKSGNWMVRVKEILGAILVAVGVYYVGLALATKGIPEKATWTVAAGVLLAVLGFVVRGSEEKSPEAAAPAGSGLKRFLRKGVGVVMVVIGAYAAVVGLSMGGFAPAWLGSGPATGPVAAQEGVQWSNSYGEEMKRAGSEGRPVIIDFHADWCVYCKKLDREVFTDDRIVNEASRFVVIKVDADKRKDLVSKHGVLGLPTVVFLDSAGAEASRIESYVKADRFLELMKAVD